MWSGGLGVFLEQLRERMLRGDPSAYVEFGNIVGTLARSHYKSRGVPEEDIGTLVPQLVYDLSTGVDRLGRDPRLLEILIWEAVEARWESWICELYEKAKDLENGTRFQAQLLAHPTATTAGIEVVACMRPAIGLSGDFHEVSDLGNDRLLVALGDATGHGTSAGLHSTICWVLLRERALRMRDPIDLLHSLNQTLMQFRLTGRFITLTLGLFEAKRGIVTIANAGGTSPFIVGLSECLDVQLDSHFLGFCERPEFCKKEMAICAGDHVVFYSDGVSEQENESGEFYGTEALKRLVRQGASLAVKEIVTSVFKDVDAFRARSHQRDDQTVIVARVVTTT